MRTTIKYQIIFKYKNKYNISEMCEFLNVSRSGYYAYLKKKDIPDKDLPLAEKIRECQEKAHRTYGYRRVQIWLERQGIKRNPKTILRVMQKYNLFSVVRRKEFNMCRNNYYYQFLIELFTGMRMGEINALRKKDIDLKNKVVYVSRTITRGENYKLSISSSTKTDAGIRDIPLTENARIVFEKLLHENNTKSDDDLLFYDNKNDSLISTEQVNDSFKRFCKKYNINCTSQHMLRHTFATRCIESDIPAEVLMKWLGHKDISVTINTYTDIFAARHNKCIDKFNEYADGNIEFKKESIKY